MNRWSSYTLGEKDLVETAKRIYKNIQTTKDSSDDEIRLMNLPQIDWKDDKNFRNKLDLINFYGKVVCGLLDRKFRYVHSGDEIPEIHIRAAKEGVPLRWRHKVFEILEKFSQRKLSKTKYNYVLKTPVEEIFESWVEEEIKNFEPCLASD